MAERGLDNDREVALEQLPTRLKAAFSALWKLDLAFADVVTTTSDQRLGAIRLAWWRERLEEMDADGPIAAEPRLQSVRSALLPAGISGRELSNLEEVWGPLLDPFPWSDAQATGLMLRGRLLFGLGARLLGARSRDAEEAGALWSLIDGMNHCSDPLSRAHFLTKAREISLPARAPVAVRPLTILTALSISTLDDLSTGWSRGAGAIWHRLTGRYPKRQVPSGNAAIWSSNDRSDP